MIGKDRCVASVLHCMNPCCQTSGVRFGELFGGSLVERFSVGPNDLLVLADGAGFRLRCDRIEDNLNRLGRAYYGFSTLLCTPASLSQEVGLALGAEAGEARIADVVRTGGFRRFRRAAETPFNHVFEARP